MNGLFFFGIRIGLTLISCDVDALLPLAHLKPHAVRSTFSPTLRTSCPTVIEPDRLMANNVSIAEGIRFTQWSPAQLHFRYRRVLMRNALTR